MVFELEQDEDNPQPTLFQGQDVQGSSPHEPTTYLENLDMSDFPDLGFDFSCLDDAGHSGDFVSFGEEGMSLVFL